MKYADHRSFEKHLAAASPKHLSAAYLVALPSAEERYSVLRSIASLFLSRGATLRRFSLEEEGLDKVLEELRTFSLLSKETVLWIDPLSALKKKEVEQLLPFIEKPSPQKTLLLGTSSLQWLEPFVELSKKDLVLLDLSKEKPWERDSRLKVWIKQKCAGQIREEALALLIEWMGGEWDRLASECDKLLTYVEEGKCIEKRDVEALCKPSQEENLFRFSEACVFDRKWSALEKNGGLSFLLPCIGALRYHFELGWQLASGEVEEVKPYLVQKHEKRAKELGSRYFQKGLSALYGLESKSKEGGVSIEALWDQFCGHLLT